MWVLFEKQGYTTQSWWARSVITKRLVMRQKGREEMQIIEKAWKVNLNLVEEPYWYDHLVYHAETKGKAKIKALIDLDSGNHINGEQIDFLNMPLVRSKEDDRVKYNGIIMYRYDVERHRRSEERRKELDSLLELDTEYYYIGKRGLFYKPDCCGYTDFQWRAGVYKKEFAVSHAKACEEIILTPVNIDEHNELIHSQIEFLQGNLIR